MYNKSGNKISLVKTRTKSTIRNSSILILTVTVKKQTHPHNNVQVYYHNS